MWSDVLLEQLFRGLPESMLFIFAGYAFSRYKVQQKRYFTSSLILLIIGFIIARLLPVQFGITQVLVVIACAGLLIGVNHIPMQKAIASTLGVMILGFITEILSVVLMAVLRGIDIKTMFANKELFNSLFTSEFERLLYGLIPLVLMAIVLFSIYYISKRKGTLKDVPAGKSIE